VDAALKRYSNGAIDPDVSAAGFDVDLYFDDANLNLELQLATENAFAASTPKQTPNRSLREVCAPAVS
jgi:hypothetical protein